MTRRRAGDRQRRPGGCAGSGKDGNLQTIGAPRDRRRSSATSSSTDGTRATNYTGTLADVFSAMASVGASGCGFEQHARGDEARARQQPGERRLPAARRVPRVVFLDRRGRLLDGAPTLLGPDTSTLGPLQSFRCTRFGIIVRSGRRGLDAMNQVGPKGMCHSADDVAVPDEVASYVDVPQERSRPTRTASSSPAIVRRADAVRRSSCARRRRRHADPGARALVHVHRTRQRSTEVADPAVRIKQFLDQFPNRSTFSTICQQDLSGGLQLIAELLKAVIGSPVHRRHARRRRSEHAGPAVRLLGLGRRRTSARRTRRSRCSPSATTSRRAGPTSTNKPCWAIETDPMNCTGGQHLTLKVERSRRRRPTRTSSRTA